MNLNLKNKPFVSIIILNYNAGNLLLECVNSVLKTDYTNFEIIIVDNKSSDNSHIVCKQKFPEVKLVINPENYGYSRPGTCPTNGSNLFKEHDVDSSRCCPDQNDRRSACRASRKVSLQRTSVSSSQSNT